MSARCSSFLRWVLAMLLGLGPLGANALAALSHASVCTCCRSAAESCCSMGQDAPETPQAVADEDACPCAVIAPSGAPGAVAPRAECSRAGVRSQLERAHRVVELAWVELALPRAESIAPPPGTAPGSGPLGARVVRGPERAATLGVMRL